MTKCQIIGAGNLSWSLIPNLQRAGFEVNTLCSRNSDTLRSFQEAYGISNTCTDLSELSLEADWIFLTVPDKAIAGLAEQLAPFDGKLIHCSGSIKLSALGERKNKAVLYPLQIFTMDQEVSFKELPVFVEATPDTLEMVESLANALSDKVYLMNSEDRLRLHMGAVWACNFSNFMYRVANGCLPDSYKNQFDIYGPLVKEQIRKALAFSPENTQTGPAIRGDMTTIDQHLELLHGSDDLKKLYIDLSKAINPGLGENFL